MMNLNPTANEAAKEMIQNDVEEMMREIAMEGAYHVVVEGGYHQQELSDEDADMLTELLTDYGITGLRALVNNNYNTVEGRQNIAIILPLVRTTGPAFEEITNRLDDGNEYPGLYLDYDLHKGFITVTKNDSIK